MANYRVPVLENFAWQEPVSDEILDPTALTPSKGDRYLINGTGSGAWTGHDNDIAWFDGAEWLFDSPSEGWRCFIQDVDRLFWFDGTIWTDRLIIGDITINGDITTPNQTDWNLNDNDPESLTFVTAGMTGNMLNFDTTDDDEIVSTDATFNTKGILDIDNDINMETNSVVIDLKQNETTALSFDSTSLAGILSIDTNTGAEQVKMAGSALIVGDLTVQGTTTTIDTQEMKIEDKLITLNRGGAVSSAFDSGIEFEENEAIVGYIKTTADRGGYLLQAPGNAFDFEIDINASKTMTVNGDLNIEADSAINQDVTTDAVPTFDSLILSGTVINNIDISTNAMDFDLIDNTADALSFDAPGAAGIMVFDTTDNAERVVFGYDINTPNASDWDLVANNSSALSWDTSSLAGIMEIDSTTGSEKVNFAGGIQVSGDIATPNASDWDLLDNNSEALSFDAPGAPGMLVFDTTDGAEKVIIPDLEITTCLDWADGSSICTDGTDLTLTDAVANTVTVKEADHSYNARAQYDSTLGVIVFDQDILDVVT